jgi:hypothetical protein
MEGIRGMTCRRWTLLFVVLVASVLVLTDVAAAGWFGKKSREEVTRRPPRYDRYPTMEFASGVLHRDGISGWVVDGKRLALHSTCRVDDQRGKSGAGALRDGAPVLVMANDVGGTLVAYRIIVRKSGFSEFGSSALTDALRGDVDIVWSNSDPTVGCGRAPN